MHPARPRRRVSTILALLLALAATAVAAGPAAAHGFSSTAYAEVSATGDGALRTVVDLEYDLLVVSAAENENDDDLFQEGMDLFETGDEELAMNAHADTVVDYATERFTVSADGASCTASLVGDITVHIRDDVPYATLVLDQDCAETTGEPAAYEFSSSLFADSEGYVTDTKTIVDYDIDGEAGSAALDAQNPTFSTEQAWTDRFAEFFLLGAEHLLGGLDHVLFLLALIVGSRRLRDVVLAATTFTVAHSVTFLLAALGLVNVPAAVVEPVIALSIAIVAGWYLWTTWRRRPFSAVFETTRTGGRFGLDRSDWTRLAVVFAFGLMHGLGFAGALGIQEAWSWTLLWSLLVFNVGIEAVQLGLIALIFPVLTLLRRRAPRVGLWVGVAIAAVVTVMGLIWFVERILGLG
ncbi:HupE/UreJ family protein [Conyzicola sp.]|uniref:HupE/UreJ family protein n=1 Tax=Conyzicola sp. TaxID=1969404 RepID=UPI003989BA28